MKLTDLILKSCPHFTGLSVLPDIEIRGIETDSRAVEKDFVYVAIQGVKNDGNQYITQALSRGAAALVVEKKPLIDAAVPVIEVPDTRVAAAHLAAAFRGHPSRAMIAIGITGTNGKTTSSYILEHFLLSENKKTGVIGTINYRFDGCEIPAAQTTPGPVKMQNILSQMRDRGCEYAVMEASSHALEQKRVAGINFRAALFTNLTQDHLDYHKTMESYFESKSKLFSSLEPASVAVLNADDEWARKLYKKTEARVLTYGVCPAADLRAEALIFGADSTQWDFVYNSKKIKIHSPLIGLHNVYNVMGAMAVISAFGFSLERAAASLREFAGVPGRLEAVNAGQNFKVFVDFAHTPDGLLNVLKALQQYRKKKLLVVFGCGGDRDRDKRPKMARIAGEYSDFVYVTSDNPRSEDPEVIAKEICAGFPPDFKDYTVIIDREKAVRQALLTASDGDIVLLAGKGHEKTQVIGNQSFPFSDRQEAEKVLNGY